MFSSPSAPSIIKLMLNLQSESSNRWLNQVEEHLDEILVDHAHCERKAAGTALNLLFSYVENETLGRQMTLRCVPNSPRGILDEPRTAQNEFPEAI